MKLEHDDLDEHIEMASRHLSYGERNAFALVLFMHEVNSKKPDLVVLDDPISSFDKNKKFAILHELFRGKGSLQNCTSVLLTHDIEPAIDVVKSTAHLFAGSKPQASFLSSNHNVISEVLITRSDIETFGKVCNRIVAGIANPLIKVIYLRRHFEIGDNVAGEYNLLASLLHKREAPTFQDATGTRLMTADEKTDAETAIRAKIDDFDYDGLLAQINDMKGMIELYHSTNVGYEKIQLFRLIKGKHEDNVISKFINESYHVENEYVMQLDPRKFDAIPEYVVSECDKLLPKPLKDA